MTSTSRFDPSRAVGTIAADLFTREFREPLTIDLIKPTIDGKHRVTLTPGVLDEEAQSYLGQRYNTVLAAALCALTGWKSITLLHAPDVPPHDELCLERHSAATTPEGRLVDVFGEAAHVPALLEQWREHGPLLAHHISTRELAERMSSPRSPRSPRWWAALSHDRDGYLFVHYARLILRNRTNIPIP